MKRSPNPNGGSGRRAWYLAWCLAFPSICALAQTYTVDWYKVAGGGGTSTGGVFSISGTIGQHEAGGPMTGGDFEITGGFWPGVSTAATPGVPRLTITRVGSSVVVSWPEYPSGFRLQQNTNVANWASWGACTAAVSTNNGWCNVTFASPTGRLFFRLCQPVAPKLAITHSGRNVTASWPSTASGFVLQQNTNPANSTGWSTCTGTLSTTNNAYSVTFTPALGNLFLRLCYPK